MRHLVFVTSLLITLTACIDKEKNNTINLAGEWHFKADPSDKGNAEKWFATALNETVVLPGSMTENGKGDEVTASTHWTGQIVDSSWFKLPQFEKYRKPGNIKIPFWLQPTKTYTGAAWYQKTVDIPVSWRGKYLELFLERCHWETNLWIDDKNAGMQNTLGTPHVYDLTKLLTPGKHTITICVDNRVKDIDVGMNSHSISDHTQSNWNGMVGKLELRARSPLFASDIRIYPDLQNKRIKVKLRLNNVTGSPVKGNVRLLAEAFQNTENNKLAEIEKDVIVNLETMNLEMDYSMGPDPQTWDEFHPDLYRLNVQVSGAGDNGDQQSIIFGMRDFKTRGTQFTINGRPLFLRGTLECAIFPKTGYPPTDTASWMRIYRIARAHGLNQLRFHSWCPPEAAFEAADRSGFYLHVECSSWANSGASIGDGKPLDHYLYEESERMIRTYGNHPSFCMMLYGNEPAGKNQVKWLGEFVSYWKKKDPRRLYSSGAGWPIIPESDFNSTANPRIQGWGQGLNSIINAQAPRSDYDWSANIAPFDKPTVSHEIGQWCVYPDFKEIAQYTGVLKAKNFEIFQETLRENHLGHLADSFLLASGKLQALCYKADIEAALRTPGFAGFQLLDLHDFPGQGTALVGVLNPFWKEKGYITPKEYRKFCNSVVPLVRLPKMIYTSAETIIAPVEIANFGEKELKNITPIWTITGMDGKIRAVGELPKTTVPVGNAIKLGEINQSLSEVKVAQKFTLSVVVGTYENSWDFWVYPASLPQINEPILVTQKLDAKAIETLNKGGKVLLTIKKGSIKKDKGGSVMVGFSSIFWNTAWTHGQPPHTLGILCNPKHPALAEFPSEYHSNWQWWDAMSHSNAILLTDFSPDLVPIVRIIDDWFTNRSLGLIFEANVGKGKIIVAGVDLISDSEKRPEARQLLYSLKKYMAGKDFNPTTRIDMEKLSGIFSFSK
jgi:hypothetical protein